MEGVTVLNAATVRIDGCFTRELSVPGDGPVHLLLHGFTDSADTWRPVLARLERAGARGVALDLPGFGFADPPPFDGHMFSVFDRFVDAAVRRYGAEVPVVLAGNSLGGCFTMRAAMRDLPLAGIAPVAPAGGHMAPWLRALASRVPARVMTSKRLDGRGLPPNLTRRILTVAYARIAHASRDAVSREQVQLYLRHQVDGLVMLQRARIALALHPEILDPWDATQVTVPTHVIWGRMDRLVRSSGAVVLAGQVPGARATVLDDVGHLPQLEAPDVVAEALLGLAASPGAPVATPAAG